MLPSDVRTATVRLGPFVDDVGAPWSGRVTVTSSAPRVWDATGTVIAPRPVVVTLDADGCAALTLAVTDQPGFSDGAGRRLLGWTYTAELELDGAEPVRHTFALPAQAVPVADGPVRLVLPPAGDAPEPAPGAERRTALALASGPVPAVSTSPPPPTADPVPSARRGFTRRDTFRAGAVALTAAAASAAHPAAAAGPSVPSGASSVPASVLRGATVLPAATVIADDVTIGSTANPSTLLVKSSAAGGTTGGAGYHDSTGRIVLETYQPHFRSYGESVRVQLKDPRAKGMLTYQGHWTTPHYPDGDYTWLDTHPQQPVTLAWIGAHFLNNDDPDDPRKNLWHGHINFEVPDAHGALRTRLEIKLIDPVTGKIGTDRSAIRTNMADFEHQVGAAGEQVRIVGSDARDKDLVFATEVGARQPRWTLRTTRGEADLEFRRYRAGRDFQDSPLRLDRQTGLVEVGGAQGTSAGMKVVQDGGVGITVLPLAAGGQGILVAGRAGDRTARVIQGEVTGDVVRRFVAQVDGTLLWGDGAADRDTLLYRRARNQLGTDGGLFLRSSSAPPTATTGGVLFVQDGALRYRGSRGTVTTIAAA